MSDIKKGHFLVEYEAEPVSDTKDKAKISISIKGREQDVAKALLACMDEKEVAPLILYAAVKHMGELHPKTVLKLVEAIFK